MADVRPCSIDGCIKYAKWAGLCQPHYLYDRYKDTPPPSDAVLAGRIFPKVVENTATGCWEWQGAGHAKTGHGMFGYNALGRCVTRYVHVWMWEYLVGPIPDGLVLDHLCRVTRCCNPQHLEPVTNGVNILRGEGSSAKNARKTHCKRGHEFTPGNTRVVRGVYGPQRECRICRKEHRRARTERERAARPITT